MRTSSRRLRQLAMRHPGVGESVHAAPKVLVNRRPFGRYAQEVSNRCDPCAAVVTPCDTELRQSVSKALGQREDLEIEGPTIDPRAREHGIGDVARERLEATLRILDAWQQRGSDDAIGDTAPRVSPGRRSAPARGPFD